MRLLANPVCRRRRLVVQQGYLRHTREQLILTALSESHSQLTNSFYQTLDSRMRSSWDAQKRKILDEVGAGDIVAPSTSSLGGSLGASAFGRSVRGRLGESTSGLGSSMSGPLPGQTLSNHHRMVRYDQVVRQLNASRSNASSSPFPLVKSYADSLASAANNTASTSSNQMSPMLAQSFSLLASLVREGQPGVGERTYASGYAADDGQEENARFVRRGIAEGGKAFLEEQWVSDVTAHFFLNYPHPNPLPPDSTRTLTAGLRPSRHRPLSEEYLHLRIRSRASFA